MHWSLRLILDMPQAILNFRKSHIQMTKLQKIEKKNGSIAGFKAMIEDPIFAKAEVEIYIDLLPEIMENAKKYSPEDLQYFLSKGVEYGVLHEMEDTAVEIDDSWKRWEEG